MEESLEARIRIGRRGRGFAAEGPGFYVWDEDPTSLLRMACDLAEAALRAEMQNVRPLPRREPDVR